MSKNKATEIFLCLVASAVVFFQAGYVGGDAKTIRINKVAYNAAPDSASLDAAMKLKKFFLFPSLDDVNGALSSILDGELAAAISRDTRFNLVKDPEILKALGAGEKSYAKVAASESVHGEAIKAADADGSIFLRSRTIGGNLELVLELRDRGGVVLLRENGSLPAFSSRGARAKQISDMFSALVEKIPFRATVTGRSAKTITVDLGRGHVKPGDELEVVRLVSLQRHPLLKTMVGVDYTKVGVAKVSNVDRVLAFADIIEEAPGEAISSDNKIVAIRPGAPSSKKNEDAGLKERSDAAYSIKQRDEDITPRLEGDLDRAMPQFGYVTADVGYGTISHQHSTGAAAVEAAGSGLGAALGAELWITKNWALGGGIQLQSAGLDSTGSTSAASLGDASWSKFQIYGGYRMIPGKLDELVVLFAAGASTVKAGLPNNASLGTGPRSYTGLLFKAEGDILIFPKNRIGVGVEIIPFGTFEETGTGFGEASSVNEVGLHIDWLRELYPNLWGRVGLKLELANASITGSGTNSDKRFIFGPGVLYYF